MQRYGVRGPLASCNLPLLTSTPHMEGYPPPSSILFPLRHFQCHDCGQRGWWGTSLYAVLNRATFVLQSSVAK